MTCEHCKDEIVTLSHDNAGANTIRLDFTHCNDVGCETPTVYCLCECHRNVTAGGAQ